MTPARIVFTALLPFASGYFMSYLLRAVNAVVAPDLVRDAALSPAQLGLLTAAYLGAFALFQLPLGVLLSPSHDSCCIDEEGLLLLELDDRDELFLDPEAHISQRL